VPCCSSSCTQAARREGSLGVSQMSLHGGQSGQASAAVLTSPAGQQDASNSIGNTASGCHAGCSNSQAVPISRNSRVCSLHGLHQLSLYQCTCWVAEPSSPDASPPEFGIRIGCSDDVLSLLLDPSGTSSSLKCLELWDMHLGCPEMELIMCSPLGDKLEQLVVTQRWGFRDVRDDSSDAARAGVQQAPQLGDIVSAAVKAGKLQELKVLCVVIPGSKGGGRAEQKDCSRQGHMAFWGDTEQGPLTGGHCKCFRRLRQLRS
jgi:hypothetical protein